MSDSLQPHGPQLARLSCPSLSPGTCSNSCPLSRWCHPTISSSVAPAPLLSIFPSIRVFSNESFHIRWPKYWSFSISPSSEYQGWFPLGLTDLISSLSKGLSRLLQLQSLKASILQHSDFFMAQLSHPYMTTGKTISLNTWTVVAKVMCLLLNTLSKFVVSILPKSKRLLISWHCWISTFAGILSAVLNRIIF